MGCGQSQLSEFESKMESETYIDTYIEYLNFFFNKFILFLAVLGHFCCMWVFSSCGEQGLLLVAVRRLLIAVASLVAEHGL